MNLLELQLDFLSVPRLPDELFSEMLNRDYKRSIEEPQNTPKCFFDEKPEGGYWRFRMVSVLATGRKRLLRFLTIFFLSIAHS
jgi:hypothetical protein